MTELAGSVDVVQKPMGVQNLQSALHIVGLVPEETGYGLQVRGVERQ